VVAGESGFAGGGGDGVAIQDQLLGDTQPELFQPGGGGGAELHAEQSAEVPGADGRVLGEAGDGVLLPGLAADGVQDGLQDGVAHRGGVGGGGELGLAAGAVHEHHHVACDAAGDLSPLVLHDEGEGEVDAGGDAGGGDVLAVVDVEGVGLDPYEGEASGEILGVLPVGSGASAVEEAELGEDERPRAHAGHTLGAVGEVTCGVEKRCGNGGHG